MKCKSKINESGICRDEKVLNNEKNVDNKENKNGFVKVKFRQKENGQAIKPTNHMNKPNAQREWGTGGEKVLKGFKMVQMHNTSNF